MTNGSSRFTYEAPGVVRCIYLIIRHPSDWRERMRAWITDHELGERFQLSEDEESMMSVLSDLLIDAGRRDRTQWTPANIDTAKDYVLTAIADKRQGDTSMWECLKAMERDQWTDWLASQVKI